MPRPGLTRIHADFKPWTVNWELTTDVQPPSTRRAAEVTNNKERTTGNPLLTDNWEPTTDDQPQINAVCRVGLAPPLLCSPCGRQQPGTNNQQPSSHRQLITGRGPAGTGLGVDGVPDPGPLERAGPDRGASGPVDLERGPVAVDRAHRDASGRRVWPSHRPGESAANGGEGPVCAKGTEGHSPLASQEERPPAGTAEVARGHCA